MPTKTDVFIPREIWDAALDDAKDFLGNVGSGLDELMDLCASKGGSGRLRDYYLDQRECIEVSARLVDSPAVRDAVIRGMESEIAYCSDEAKGLGYCSGPLCRGATVTDRFLAGDGGLAEDRLIGALSATASEAVAEAVRQMGPEAARRDGSQAIIAALCEMKAKAKVMDGALGPNPSTIDESACALMGTRRGSGEVDIVTAVVTDDPAAPLGASIDLAVYRFDADSLSWVAIDFIPLDPYGSDSRGGLSDIAARYAPEGLEAHRVPTELAGRTLAGDIGALSSCLIALPEEFERFVEATLPKAALDAVAHARERSCELDELMADAELASECALGERTAVGDRGDHGR